MKITYMGHSQGKTKAGNDMTVLHYSYADARTTGLATNRAFIFGDSGIHLPKNLGGGEVLDADFDNRGNLVGLELATPIK